MFILFLPFLTFIALACTGGWLIVRGVRRHVPRDVRFGVLFVAPLGISLVLQLFVWISVFLTGNLMRP